MRNRKTRLKNVTDVVWRQSKKSETPAAEIFISVINISLSNDITWVYSGGGATLWMSSMFIWTRNLYECVYASMFNPRLLLLLLRRHGLIPGLGADLTPLHPSCRKRTHTHTHTREHAYKTWRGQFSKDWRQRTKTHEVRIWTDKFIQNSTNKCNMMGFSITVNKVWFYLKWETLSGILCKIEKKKKDNVLPTTDIPCMTNIIFSVVCVCVCSYSYERPLVCVCPHKLDRGRKALELDGPPSKTSRQLEPPVYDVGRETTWTERDQVKNVVPFLSHHTNNMLIYKKKAKGLSSLL